MYRFSFRYFVLFIALLVAVMLGAQIFSQRTVAGSPAATPLQPYQGTAPNDALARALLAAQSFGLTDKPDAIYVKLDEFKQFEEPGENWHIWDSRAVWAIRLDKHFNLKGHGLVATSGPVDHIVFFIDQKTGTMAGMRAGLDLTPRLQAVDWRRAQESDTGNFPVGNENMPPEFYSKLVEHPDNPGATAIPHK